jgi:cephalosporin-C deacetylase
VRRLICSPLLVLLLLLPWGAAFAAPPAPDVAVAAQEGGGYLVTTPVYTARVGVDGNLHSLLVNGIEFLDDKVPGSAGAAFFVEHPLPLPTVTGDGRTVTATDGTYRILYEFEEGYLTLTLKQTSGKGAAYTLVGSQPVAFVENLIFAGVAAAPAADDWPDVVWRMSTGEFLELRGGSRIWGASQRQVWERRDIAPGKEYTLMLVPGRGEPRTPSLAQLTTLDADFPQPDQVMPAGAPVAVQLKFGNNAAQAITGDLHLRATASNGTVLLEERKPLSCEAHSAVTVPWTLSPQAPDFYAVTASIDLGGGVTQTLTETFGYDVAHLAPTAKAPADFAEYWAKVQAEAKADDVTLTRLEDKTKSTASVIVYRIGFETAGATCFGWLSVPRFPGRYPGLLLLPGERVRHLTPSASLADCGFVVMTLEPTGQPVDGTIKPLITQAYVNLHDPATVGLRAVMVRTLRALAALATVPEVDPNRLGVNGVSMGGAMALILAALDERVQAVAADVPYFCGIEQDKDAAIWPYQEVSDYLKSHPDQQDGVWATLRYYEMANFLDRLTCPALVSAGINDSYSRPATIVALCNKLPGPHVLKLYLGGHEGGGPVHWEAKVRWLGQVLGGPAPVPAAKADAPKAEAPKPDAPAKPENP